MKTITLNTDLFILFVILYGLSIGLISFFVAYSMSSESLTTQCYNAFIYSNQKIIYTPNESKDYNISLMRFYMKNSKENINQLNIVYVKYLFDLYNISYENITDEDILRYEHWNNITFDSSDYFG